MSGNDAVEDSVGEEYQESAYEVALRLYGRSLEPRTRRELERSLEAWRELGSADRTFVLAHLGMLRLRAVEEAADAIEGLQTAPPGPSEHTLFPEDEPTEEINADVLDGSNDLVPALT